MQELTRGIVRNCALNDRVDCSSEVALAFRSCRVMVVVRNQEASTTTSNHAAPCMAREVKGTGLHIDS